MISIHTQTHEKRCWRRRWNTHRHTKMKILAEKIVKKIRSSISRPHRTQFPLVHINIHTQPTCLPSFASIWLSHAHTHTRRHSFRHARMDVAMETFCVVKQMEKRGSHAPQQQQQPTTTENQRRRDRLRLNQHIRTQPTTRRRRTHTHTTHMITHIHTQVHSHTPVAHFRSS